jgi:hypothetical protein
MWCGPCRMHLVDGSAQGECPRLPCDRPRRPRLKSACARWRELSSSRRSQHSAEGRAIGPANQAVHRKQDKREDHGQNGVDRGSARIAHLGARVAERRTSGRKTRGRHCIVSNWRTGGWQTAPSLMSNEKHLPRNPRSAGNNENLSHGIRGVYGNCTETASSRLRRDNARYHRSNGLFLCRLPLGTSRCARPSGCLQRKKKRFLFSMPASAYETGPRSSPCSFRAFRGFRGFRG